MAKARAPLIKAINLTDLTGYFAFLDDLRESGAVNMFAARAHLEREYAGMSRQEARAVHEAWMDTFSNSLPPEDRAEQAQAA